MEAKKPSKATLQLSDYEKYILLLIIGNDNLSYGVDIKRGIKKRTGKDLSIAAIYTNLDRLKEKAYLVERDSPVDETDANIFVKRYFSVTPLGFEVLTQAIKALHRLYENVFETAVYPKASVV